MKTISFIFALTVAAQVWAVDFTPAKQILMTGQNCEELNAYAKAISGWEQSLTKTVEPLPECFCSSKSCQMDVSSISPYFVKDVTNFNEGLALSSAYNGPNCFNAALVSKNTLPKLNFTHPYEMTAILNSSLCKERKIDEPLRPGDILVVRDQRNGYFEIHAGIYIGGDLSFSKYGESSMMPYSYGFNVDKSYGVFEEACRRIEGVPVQGDVCYEKPFVNYFDCKPIYTYISGLLNQPGGIDPTVQKIYAETSGYDLRISDVSFAGGKITDEVLQKYQVALLDLYSRSKNAMSDPSIEAKNRELARLMHFHIFSLYEQLRIIAKGSGFSVTPSLPKPE